MARRGRSSIRFTTSARLATASWSGDRAPHFGAVCEVAAVYEARKSVRELRFVPEPDSRKFIA